MQFKTKSRAIELLGRKQIRDGTTALAELLKNSFDADAKFAKAIFNTQHIQPYLMISDSGCGMTKKDILDKWLVIGTNSKKRESKFSDGGRPLMGEKGIGRLASAALGQQLMMFSKSKINGKWNIVFIDWNVFENPYSFIEDVEVGAEFESDFSFTDRIEQLTKELVTKVHSNIYKDSWFITYDKDNNLDNDGYLELKADNIPPLLLINNPNERFVRSDLNNLRNNIDLQLKVMNINYPRLKNQLSMIENIGHGTLLLITNLHDNWQRILDWKKDSKSLDNDFTSKKNYTRMQTLLYTLNHTVKDFSVELFFNDIELPIEYGFSEEDYSVYDLKIEGTVKNGTFFGKIDAVNADKNILDACNNELLKGIDIADTIAYDIRQKSDCGPYKLTLCHLEGTERNTGLPYGLWKKQYDKLQEYGGVMIFRDGVRILPYGERENDFLELDSRRNKGAGYYHFAHRRFFGRIDITQESNPLLEDKSSREGFIENEQYYYLVKTLQTLLIKIAVDYMNRGLRDSYINYNNRQFELKEKEEAAAAEQKKLLKEELARINRKLADAPTRLAGFCNIFEDKLNQLEEDFLRISTSNKFKEIVAIYHQLSDELHDASLSLERFSKEITIYISDKFLESIPHEMILQVENTNFKVFETINGRKVIIEERKQFLNRLYNERIADWRSQLESINGEGLEYYKNSLLSNIESIDQSVKHLSNSLLDEVNQKTRVYFETISRIANEIDNFKSKKSQIETKVKNVEFQYIDNLNRYKNALFNIENYEPNIIKTQIDKLTNELKETSNRLYDIENELRRKISDELESISPNLKGLSELLNSDVSINSMVESLTRRNLQLEREIEVMTDLANVGLAAEIVDHEFNQYFTNVKNAISDLSALLLDNASKYYLNQIETGFSAIGNRHSQLSPMYRSYNLKRKATKVVNMVKEVVEFFRFRLDDSGIEVIYDIPDSEVIKISQSKIYPVISNLIENAMYWVASKESKKIMFRYDTITNSLYVEDSGPGISPRLKDRVFEKFFTLKPYSIGRGLGLTIAKRVLEMEGYSIEVITDSSEKMLEGACFKIQFGKEK